MQFFDMHMYCTMYCKSQLNENEDMAAPRYGWGFIVYVREFSQRHLERSRLNQASKGGEGREWGREEREEKEQVDQERSQEWASQEPGDQEQSQEARQHGYHDWVILTSTECASPRVSLGPDNTEHFCLRRHLSFPYVKHLQPLLCQLCSFPVRWKAEVLMVTALNP